jgi:hypothetical protein
LVTFKEHQKNLTNCQHQLAIWEFLYAHLDTNYISRDGRTVEKALRVSDCLVEIVPEDAVEEVLKFISEGPIKDYQERIEAIENQEIGKGNERKSK